MAKKNKWTVEVDGVNHVIECKRGFKIKLIVDGNEKVLKSKNAFICLIDETIDLGSKKVHLVVIGSKIDLAVDGIFLKSKKEYKPIDSLPKYTWIFVGACMLPLIVFLGGVFNAIFGIFGVTFCINNIASQDRSTVTKVILNIITVALVWVADIGMILFATSALR